MKTKEIGRFIKQWGDEFSYRFPWLKFYFRPIYHKLFLDRYIYRRKTAFLTKSYDVINKFDICLTQAGVQYSLGFGSMLGAIREKGIIGHDADLDTLVWAEGDNCALVKECLENGGFIRTRCFLIDEGKLGREETYEYDSVPIDVFYIYPPIKELPYTAYYRPVEGYSTIGISMRKTGRVEAFRLERPYEKEYIRVTFGPLKLPIMKHYDPILRACYGDNFMVPDPNFKRKDQNKWEGVHAKMG